MNATSSQRGDTREKIIDLARNLLHSRGFEGFSYADISSELGIRNAAVHYYFPSKSDLGLAMLERFTDEVRARIDRARRDKVPAQRQLDAYFDQVESDLCERDWVMCPMGALASCFDALPDNMKSASQRLTRVLHEWMAEILEQGRAQNEFSFEGDAADKAMELSCAVTGARQMSRVQGKNLVGRVANQIRKDLYR